MEEEPHAAHVPPQPVGPGPAQPPPAPVAAPDLHSLLTQILAAIGDMRQAPAPAVPAPVLQDQPPPVHVAAPQDLEVTEMPLRDQKMLGVFQRFQQGQTSRPIQAALPISEGGQYQQSGPSTGQNSRGSDSFPPCRGRVTTGRSTSGCYDCGALDHWSRECPRRGRGVIVPAPPTSKPISAVSSSARGGGQIQDRRESRQVTRGGARGGRSENFQDGSCNGALVLESRLCPQYCCYPLELREDILVNSATKFISGYSDLMAGFSIACLTLFTYWLVDSSLYFFEVELANSGKLGSLTDGLREARESEKVFPGLFG
uniref:CCHC-type domain-containing protein n=1 Tax=Solanum lycopersicum TaxID=4081 RepID=A0A3Q7IX03_SOLLC